MPRRRVAAKREILDDPKYGSQILAKFMNHVMESGKKAVAERIVYGALDTVKARKNTDPLDAFEGKGAAVKKREDVHRMAEANKAFSHYRF